MNFSIADCIGVHHGGSGRAWVSWFEWCWNQRAEWRGLTLKKKKKIDLNSFQNVLANSSQTHTHTFICAQNVLYALLCFIPSVSEASASAVNWISNLHKDKYSSNHLILCLCHHFDLGDTFKSWHVYMFVGVYMCHRVVTKLTWLLVQRVNRSTRNP